MSISAPSGASSPKTAMSGYKNRQVSNFTPEMMNLFQSLLGGSQKGVGGGLDFLSKIAGGDEGAFAEAEAPAYSAFNKTLGQLGSRFSQYGAQDSSAFQNAVSGAGADLSEKLQGQRLGMQQGAIDRLLGLSSSLLGQRPFENILEEKDQGFDWGGLLGGLAGSFLGPAGGAIGKSAGSAVGKKFFG